LRRALVKLRRQECYKTVTRFDGDPYCCPLQHPSWLLAQEFVRLSVKSTSWSVVEIAVASPQRTNLSNFANGTGEARRVAEYIRVWNFIEKLEGAIVPMPLVLPKDTKDSKNKPQEAPYHPSKSDPLPHTIDEPSFSEEYSDVDIGNNDIIPTQNYDVDTTRFRKLNNYSNVWISDNFTQEVYNQMKHAGKLFVHIDARKYPEKIKNTNWRTQVNAYMRRRGYADPRAGYLIAPRSNSYYELWECNGRFDFMRFERSILRRNGGVKYGHKCHLSMIFNNILGIM